MSLKYAIIAIISFVSIIVGYVILSTISDTTKPSQTDWNKIYLSYFLIIGSGFAMSFISMYLWNKSLDKSINKQKNGDVE